MNKKILRTILFVIISSGIAFAQPPPDEEFPIDEIPIDTGLEWLVAAGLLYGARVMFKKIKK